MVHLLVQIDVWLFSLINHTLANSLFDLIMPWVTDLNHWKIPILLIWLALIVFGKKTGRLVAVLIIFTILLSDQTSSFVIKPLVGRIRPCNALADVRLLVSCPGSFSFPSSHAVNIFATATLFSYFYQRYCYFFYGFASLIAYSRVYVGVHYPFDVIAGAFWGMCCGLIVAGIFQYLVSRINLKKRWF